MRFQRGIRRLETEFDLPFNTPVRGTPPRRMIFLGRHSQPPHKKTENLTKKEPTLPFSLRQDERIELWVLRSIIWQCWVRLSSTSRKNLSKNCGASTKSRLAHQPVKVIPNLFFVDFDRSGDCFSRFLSYIFHDLFSFLIDFWPGNYNQSENRSLFKQPFSKCAQFLGRYRRKIW